MRLKHDQQRENTTEGSRHEMFHGPQDEDELESIQNISGPGWILPAIWTLLLDICCRFFMVFEPCAKLPWISYFLWGKPFCSWPAESYNVQESVIWDKLLGNNLALLTGCVKIFDTSFNFWDSKFFIYFIFNSSYAYLWIAAWSLIYISRAYETNKLIHYPNKLFIILSPLP